LQTWGEPGTGPAQFSTPHGIWGNTQGDLFIAEMNPTRVSKLERIYS